MIYQVTSFQHPHTMTHDRAPLGGPVDDPEAVSLLVVGRDHDIGVIRQPAEVAAIPVLSSTPVHRRSTNDPGNKKTGWLNPMGRL